MKIKILDPRLHDHLPSRATSGSAGLDLRACIDEPIPIYPDTKLAVSTGISVAIPEGFVGLLFARSGLSTKVGIGLSNSVGVIDSDYRGVLTAVLKHNGPKAYTLQPMERVAQLVVVPYWTMEPEFVEDLDETERTGGFGHSGSV